jgi:parallel beta-helix repeat protein
VVRIQQVKAWNGTVYILPDGSISPSTAPIRQNGDFYTLTDSIISNGDGIVVERNGTKIDGMGYTIQGDYGGVGINLTSICDVTIRNMNVQGFYYGIFLASASQNTILGNNLTANDIAIVLVSYSDDNDIKNNNVKENINFGIWLDGSSNNSICHNNFVNNTQQAYTTYDSINTWDIGYPKGGNYWSNYDGTDLDQDRIGDTPYLIGSNNQDNYPLMNPWIQKTGDVNYDGRVDVKDVYAVSRAYGTSLQGPNPPGRYYNPDCDINNDLKIDVRDLYIVCTNYGK